MPGRINCNFTFSGFTPRLSWPQTFCIAAFCSLLVAAAVPVPGLAADYKAPRTRFGAPSLEGMWNNSSITTLERPASISTLVMTEDQAAALERRAATVNANGDMPTNPDAPPPTKGGDPGGYNQGFWDQGTRVARIGGQPRSSWIVEPANGKLPYTPAAREAERAAYVAVRATPDNPEQRAPAERCIVGYGSTSGPPMLNVGYNNNYQIMQTKDEVVIVVEMIHDARIVRLNTKKHLPPNVRPWMGDSIGWWEGETLVVETTNFNPADVLRISGALTYLISVDAKITERFTRSAADQILYTFEVDDPETFTQKWRAEMPLNATKDRMYEYACEEGNYSLQDILAGARQAEAASQSAAAR